MIPFARFMELALYCPNLGYYERLQSAPGRQGDFFTSVSVGPLFGRLLAPRFAGWLDELGDGPVQLVEAGAHDGRLATDILEWFETEAMAGRGVVWERLEYWIFEPSPRRREWQARQLARFGGKIRWLDGPEHLARGAIRGVLFSNELLDAFPVTRLRWSAIEQRWIEAGVRWSGTKFAWGAMPAAEGRTSAVLAEAGLEIPAELATVLPDGFTLDLAEGAGPWWRAAAEALGRGRLVTIDYGCRAEALLDPSRATGTLRGYRDHRPVSDILDDPGSQDLTSHVNFSPLIREGEQAGLRSEPLQTQSQFLHGIAREVWTQAGVERIDPGEARQFQTLTHPEHLGRRFQVLVQTR